MEEPSSDHLPRSLPHGRVTPAVASQVGDLPGRDNLPPMDIEEFYDGDPRRRPSAEIELGTEWRDAHGIRYELTWVEDTGELYVMREPSPHIVEDPFGGTHSSIRHSEEVENDGQRGGADRHP